MQLKRPRPGRPPIGQHAMTVAERTRRTRLRKKAMLAVLLFHGGGEWTNAKREEWKRLTGKDEATTKVLCDYIRSALP